MKTKHKSTLFAIVFVAIFEIIVNWLINAFPNHIVTGYHRYFCGIGLHEVLFHSIYVLFLRSFLVAVFQRKHLSVDQQIVFLRIRLETLSGKRDYIVSIKNGFFSVFRFFYHDELLQITYLLGIICSEEYLAFSVTCARNFVGVST